MAKIPLHTGGIASFDLDAITDDPHLPFSIHYDVRAPHHANDPALHHPHRHGFYALIISGTRASEHMVDFETVCLPPESMFLMLPGQVHLQISEHLISPGKPVAANCYMSFSAEFLLHHPIVHQRNMRVITPPPDIYREIRHIAWQAQEEYDQRGAGYPAMLQHYLSLMLLLYTRCGGTRAETSGPELLARYRELIAAHYRAWTKPTAYAQALHVTPNHLNDIVKQHTGQTASDLINEARLLEAKRMLRHTQESVKEIAWYLHFNEVTYFNRFFKQHTGQTPVTFRNSTRELYHSSPD